MIRQTLRTQPMSPAPASTSPKASRAGDAKGGTAQRSRTLTVAWLLLLATVLLAIGLVALRRQTLSDGASVAMDAAAALYAAGDPALAQRAYEQAVAQGGGGVELAYNLGAAALRAGDLEQAVAALQEAHRLAPRDGAVAEALEVALEAQRQAGFAPDISLSPAANTDIKAFLQRVQDEWLTQNEMALVALALWILVAALVLLAMGSGRWRTWAVGGLFMVGLGLAIALAALIP